MLYCVHEVCNMTKDEIGKILKSARERAGLTQTQVAEKISRTQQVIGHWETGYSQPDANTLFVLCGIYDISIDDAFGFGKKVQVSTLELAHLKKYRALDTHGQRAVNAVLDVEHDRCSMPAPVARPLPINVIKMQVYDDPAAAGIPIYAESAYEYMDFPEDDVPSGADFGIRISGDSMEPTVRDGQIVWIKSQPELYAGQVGVFMLDGGEAVCKRARVRDDGRVSALESDNPKYAPIEGSDLEGLRVVGRVLL